MTGLLRALLVLAFMPTLNMCAGGGSESSGGSDMVVNPEASVAAPPEAAKMANADAGAPGESKPTESQVPAGRLVIYTGNLRVQVERLDSAATRLRKVVAQRGGYLAGESLENYSGEQRLTLTLRVPARQFEAVVAEVEGMGTYVAEKNLQAQDVTEEFRDNEARLKARRAAEAQLMSILQRARTVDEVLKVQEQLQRVREEIEVTEGRNRFLSDRVSMSTLTVTFYVVSAGAAPPQEGFFYKLWQSLGVGFDLLKGIILGLVSAWPLLILLGLGVAWIVRYERRRKAAQVAAQRNGSGTPPSGPDRPAKS